MLPVTTTDPLTIAEPVKGNGLTLATYDAVAANEAVVALTVYDALVAYEELPNREPVS